MIDTVKPFVVGVLTGAPVWVWGLLVLLIIIGWRATRERDVSAKRYALLPLFGVMSIVTIAQADPTLTIWATFIAAYALGAGYGWRAQGGIIVSAGGGRARLRGEWLTLLLMMVIFWLRFAYGAGEAISPATMSSPAMTIIFTCIAGAAAGVFLGRSLRTLHAVYAAQTLAS